MANIQVRKKFAWKAANSLTKNFKAMLGVLRLKSEADHKADPNNKLLTKLNVSAVADACIHLHWEKLRRRYKGDFSIESTISTLFSITDYVQRTQPGPKIDAKLLANLAANTAHGTKTGYPKDRGDWDGIEEERDWWAKILHVKIPQEALNKQRETEKSSSSSEDSKPLARLKYHFSKALDHIGKAAEIVREL